MSRVVRQSKYRHVFGTPQKPENCYTDIRLSTNQWDSNYVTCNTKFFAVCWEAAGGGSFAVVPWAQKGKLKSDYPLVSGHKGPVLDVDANPFNDFIFASASEDGTAKLWKIPEDGLTETLRDPVQNLSGHKRKVGNVRWHPTASNVLATSSTDYTVKVWDVEKGAAKCHVDGHADIIQSIDWNYEGSLITTACKDKKIRVIDPRTGQVVSEASAHTGVKGSRSMFLGRTGKVFTVGFSRTSDRQYAIWDPSNMGTALAQENIDTGSGLLMPFFDPDSSIIFLAGKGDGNIRYYELTDNGSKIYFLSQYQSNVPARGMAYYPKYGVDVGSCEISRLVKATTTGIEPISFNVPRKEGLDVFQDDIYPPTAAPEPTVTSDEWFGGKTVPPKQISLEGGFVARERPADFNPTEVKVTEDEGPASEKDLRAEWRKQKDRIAFLESELAKKDALLKQLQGN
jgi:coronin-1B/1C/6